MTSKPESPPDNSRPHRILSVDALRGFENNYRENLTGSLQRLLASIKDDRPEPGDVPELAQNRSDTPRLDALASGDNA